MVIMTTSTTTSQRMLSDTISMRKLVPECLCKELMKKTFQMFPVLDDDNTESIYCNWTD